MNGHDGLDRILGPWFESQAAPPGPPDALRRALDGTRTRRPRPAWLAPVGSHWVGGREAAGRRPLAAHAWPGLGRGWALALVVLLGLVAVGAGVLLVGAFWPRPSPSPSPTGRPGELAYGLGGSIYLADHDGSDPVRVASGVSDLVGDGPCEDGSYGGPTWSPDGRYLAYQGARDPACALTEAFLADADGHVVGSFEGQGGAWSPDSTRVASWAGTTVPDSEGYLVAIHGLDGVLQTLLPIPKEGCRSGGDKDPVWSPDGLSVVVWPCEIPVDGRPPTPLPATDPRTRSQQWAYSPDGTRIAYPDGGRDGGLSGTRIAVAAADGSLPKVLVATWGGDPRWSPTGDRIAFVGRGSSGRDELGLVDVASGTVVTLAVASGSAESIDLIGFSAPGDEILFSRSDTDLNTLGLWSVGTDGSEPQLLVAGTDTGEWRPAD